MTVMQAQCLLLYLGYSPGFPDNVAGAKTSGAASAFQADYGLPVTGKLDETTCKMLVAAVSGTAPKVEKPEAAGNTAQPQTGDWWAGIKYFKRSEFKCKCGGRYCNGYPAEMQEAVVKIADAAREHFGRPAYVVSGLRCQQWNAHEGGVANSQHMYGEAIDLRVDGVDSETLRQFVASQPGHRYSYCINSTNVHFDINKVGR